MSRRPISTSDIQIIRATGAKVHRMRTRRSNRFRYSISYSHSRNDALLALSIEGCVVLVELAADFPADTKRQAKTLQNAFDDLGFFARGQHDGSDVGETIYFRQRSDVLPDGSKRRRRGLNLVIYSDRPSKVFGSHCCHIELRATGAQVCARLGIGTVSELARLTSEHIGEIIAQSIGLAAVRLDVLGRALRKCHPRKAATEIWPGMTDTEFLTRCFIRHADARPAPDRLRTRKLLDHIRARGVKTNLRNTLVSPAFLNKRLISVSTASHELIQFQKRTGTEGASRPSGRHRRRRNNS